MLRLILIASLIGLLTACGVGLPPLSSKLVEKAIALQISPTQQQVSQQLGLDFKGFALNHIKVTQQETLLIENLPSYHVRGTYDITFKLPQRQVKKQQNLFDIYLQLQKEAKSWRLAIPEFKLKDAKPAWRTYLIE